LIEQGLTSHQTH